MTLSRRENCPELDLSTNKIFVTGGCGFIGSHLCELLVKTGHPVVAFDRYNPNNDWGWLEYAEGLDGIDVVLGDIRDYDSVIRAMTGCAAVFHLAALIGIPYSYISPLGYIRTNVEGTYNVLEAARELKIKEVIVTSTSETYGTAQYVPINEQHPLIGQSPYSASKIAADQLSLSYFHSFDLPIKVVRPFNTYGPRQSARAVIPTVISQALAGAVEITLGNTSPRRDLTYVSDTCAGMLEVFRSHTLYGEVTNIGMNAEISIAELVDMIGSIMGRQLFIAEENERKRPIGSEVERLRCDNTKILQKTSWRPKFELQDGLKRTIEWFSNTKNQAFYKHNVYNV